MEPQDIWIVPKVSIQAQRRHYCKESTKHPAKMPIFLAQKIINEYTKHGDLVLDPMAGIGTTLVEAVLLGRNVIGVEYEQKFFEIIKKNLKGISVYTKLVGKFGAATVLKGDSRKLNKLLNDPVDVVVFSPPYSNRLVGTRKDSKSSMIYRMSKKEGFGSSLTGKYSNGKDNIGNMPHGTIDAVIISPPFSDRVHTVPENFAENHPTRGKNNYGVYKDAEYSKDEKNIGNLKHGKVDTVILSPPFESTLEGSDNDDIEKFKHGSAGKDYTSNGKDENQVGNLEGETYLSAMQQIYVECLKALKPDGLMVLHTKNFVRKGKQVRLDLETIKLCESVGFKLKERKYRKLDTTSFWINNARKKWYKANPDKTSGDPYAQYEDILVFNK